MNDLPKKRLDELRSRAQEALIKGELELADFQQADKEKMESLIQELQIYQAELEIQNHELRKTQIALETEHRKYLALFENLPIPALVVNQEGLIKQANTQACHFFNLSYPKNLVQYSIYRLFATDSQPWLSESLHHLDEQQSVLSQQLQALVNNTEVRVQANTCLLPTEYHLDTHILITLVDLSIEQERNLIRNTLQSVLEQNLDQVMGFDMSSFEHSKALVLVTDKEHNILYLNHALEEVSGYTLDEVQGLRPSIWRSDHNLSGTFDELNFHLQHGYVWIGQLINQRKKGGVWTELRTVQALRNRQGDISGYVSLGMDLSDQVALEEQAQRVGRLEAAYTLIAGLNHEFNNLLGSVTGLTEVNLALTAEDSPIYANLEQTLVAAQRAETLLHHLRKGQSTLDLQKTSKEINAFIKQEIPIFHSILGRNIQLEIELTSTPLWVQVDTGYFLQALVNLLKNARDALADTEQPQCKIKTKLVRGHTKLEQYVEILIQDNGCGMPEEVRQRLFDPFFSTKPADKGTGLGMMAVLNFIKGHDGFIDVYSSIHQGTQCILKLPVTK
ncbi:PAS domain S-box-containing protein [Allopseudospirillum japonicum]|uniref:histidine kinase n=1 Tax=Allopseudospirillum japonicum TaxID=64971 RepID=A0A1H6Q0F8_9GAMM|nr:PAS domain-containing sensor histidine kinase [Allopseudospirillum japonicum]SEI37353.1 PAS domain S-box-containing protein [Allopseudospirillum japonicum]